LGFYSVCFGFLYFAVLAGVLICFFAVLFFFFGAFFPALCPLAVTLAGRSSAYFQAVFCLFQLWGRFVFRFDVPSACGGGVLQFLIL